MLALQPFTATDYQCLISWIHSAELLLQFAGPAFTYPLTEAQLEATCQEAGRHCFKAVESSTGSAIGHGEITLKESTAWLGRLFIAPAYRHQGYGQQLVRALLQLCFDTYGCTLVKLNVFEHNTTAIRCYQQCGFTINSEGAFERALSDTVWKGVQMRLAREAWSVL